MRRPDNPLMDDTVLFKFGGDKLAQLMYIFK